MEDISSVSTIKRMRNFYEGWTDMKNRPLAVDDLQKLLEG